MALDALRCCAATGTFDLMLLDVNMPEMDGMECVQRVRAETGWGRR